MLEKAYVNSLSAVQEFRGALATYVHESKKGVVGLEVEIRRACDYVAVDRAQYWRHEIRRAMEAVARARDDLTNARTFKTINDHTPACVDEQKALARAKERLKFAEEKSEAVKKWTRAIQHELNEYIGRMSAFSAVLEGDLPKAMAAMDRILASIETYLTTIAPTAMSESHIDRVEEQRSMASPAEVLQMEKSKDDGEETADQQSFESRSVSEAPPLGQSVSDATEVRL